MDDYGKIKGREYFLPFLRRFYFYPLFICLRITYRPTTPPRCLQFYALFTILINDFLHRIQLLRHIARQFQMTTRSR